MRPRVLLTRLLRLDRRDTSSFEPLCLPPWFLQWHPLSCARSENIVKVHTLGTDSWKSVSVFPFVGVYVQSSGQYASGTINWLVYMEIKQGIEIKQDRFFIASLDLGNESYQK
ncbi:F-box protein, partial [Trifolium medium]|nr:F-box protein [Trifolium medium]